MTKSTAFISAAAIAVMSLTACGNTAAISETLATSAATAAETTTTAAAEVTAAEETTAEATSAETTIENTLTEDKIREIVLPDLLAALNAIDCLGASVVEVDNADTYIDSTSGYEYIRVSDARYGSVSDIDSFLNTYLTEKMRASNYSAILDTEDCMYTEKDGKLYVLNGGRGCGFVWNDVPAVINDITEASFTAVKEYNNIDSVTKIKLGVVDAGNGWKIDTLDFVEE